MPKKKIFHRSNGILNFEKSFRIDKSMHVSNLNIVSVCALIITQHVPLIEVSFLGTTLSKNNIFSKSKMQHDPWNLSFISMNYSQCYCTWINCYDTMNKCRERTPVFPFPLRKSRGNNGGGSNLEVT